MDNKKAVMSAIKKAGRPVKNADVATATGIPKDEVGKIMAVLKKEGIVSSPKACSYELAK